MRISDWSSDVCSSDLLGELALGRQVAPGGHHRDIDAVRRGAVDHPVDMVPIIIFARPGGVVARRGARAGGVAVDKRWRAGEARHLRRVEQHELADVETLSLAHGEIAFSLVAGAAAEKQPGRM